MDTDIFFAIKKKYCGNPVWKGFLIDATEKRERESKIEHLAKFDFLTGIYNKRQFYKKVENAILDFLTFKTKYSLLFIDLDRFKELNDGFGHIIGDEILKHFVAKVKTFLGPKDCFGRLGGDEFCILLGSDLEESCQIVSKLKENIEKIPFLIENKEIYLTWSGGLSEIGHDTLSVPFLLEKADKALYLAKDLGRNNFVTVE